MGRQRGESWVGWLGAGSGRLQCALQASWASLEIGKEKVTLKEAESSTVPVLIHSPNSAVFSLYCGKVESSGTEWQQATRSVFVAVW